MGLRRKLFYRSFDPGSPRRSQHKSRHSGRLATVPVPPPTPVGQRWSSHYTLNAPLPRSSVPPAQRRSPPPPYTVIATEDRLPRHPQPASIYTNPPIRSHGSNQIARDVDQSRIPTSLPPRRSSASSMVTRVPCDTHAAATIRRHQSSSALNNATTHTAQQTGPNFIASASVIKVRRTSQLDALRLGR
jgi:hypothetical protein